MKEIYTTIFKISNSYPFFSYGQPRVVEIILVIQHLLMLRPNTEVLISWTFLCLTYKTIQGRL